MSTIGDLIRSGALVPVAVFGTECAHEGCEDETHDGFGLCDRFSRHTPGGSDCNRAEFFLMRPNDLRSGPNVDLDDIRAALNEVLDE